MTTGDFEAFMLCFALPLVMETFEERRLYQTRSDIERVFNAVRNFRLENGVTDTVRDSVAAEYLDEDTIATTHVSQMMRPDNVLFGMPYPAYSLVRRINGEWRINFCQYAVDDLPQLNAALTSKTKKAPR